jgi:hypothetical protein
VIVDAIDSSSIFVLVLSPASNDSPQVIREVQRAAGRDIPLVALRIADISLSKSMEFFISSHQWLDAQTGPVQQHLENLSLVVQRLLAKGSVIVDPIPPDGKEQPLEEQGTDHSHRADSADEEEFLARLRKEISTASSSQELQHTIQRLDDYLAEHPHATHVRVLMHDMKAATGPVEAVTATQSSVWPSVRKALLRWGWLVAVIAIVIIAIILLVASLQ